MTLTEFFKIIIILQGVILIRGVELFDLKLVTDIAEYYNSRWILIQSCNGSDHRAINLMKEIHKSMNIYTSAFTLDDFLTSISWERDFKPLVLLSCWSCPQDCLISINTELIISKFIWLAITNVTEVTNNTDLHIPLDCLFIVAEPQEPNSYMLTEIYRTSPQAKWVHNVIGCWSQNGLEFTSVSFLERRSDFYGQKIVTLVEPEDSQNRLIAIFKHYAPIYWDLSRRLNFTIENTTDTKGQYEISIVMQFADIPSDNLYFQPLFSSWESFYFKDKGLGMQLDGYLKPFSASIWISIVPVMVFTGFLYFVATKCLHGFSGIKGRSPPLHVHIYESLYILLQKHESKEVFLSQKMITTSQWIISMCLISWYSAIFISFISVTIPEPPFRTVDDILEQGTHNVVHARHITAGILGLLEHTTDVKLKKLYKNHYDPSKNVYDNPVDELCAHPNYLFMTSDLHMKRVRAELTYEECSISYTRIKLAMRHFTWSIVPGSQYRRFIRFHLSKLSLAGTLNDHFIKRESFREPLMSNNFRGIHLEDVMSLIIALAGGTVVSVMVWIMEIIYIKYTSSKT